MPDFHQFIMYAMIFCENLIKCLLTTHWGWGWEVGYARFVISLWEYVSKKKLGTTGLQNKQVTSSLFVNHDLQKKFERSSAPAGVNFNKILRTAFCTKVLRAAFLYLHYNVSTDKLLCTFLAQGNWRKSSS